MSLVPAVTLPLVNVGTTSGDHTGDGSTPGTGQVPFQKTNACITQTNAITVAVNSLSVGSTIYYPATPITSSTIAAAISLASSSGGGIVQLPTGTYTMTAPILLYNNVIVQGAGFNYPLSGYPIGGTILTGNGTFPCFYHSNTVQGSLPANSTIFIAEMLVGAGVSDMNLSNFSYGIQIGNYYNPGCASCYFSNIGAEGCTQWGFWIENYFHSTFDHLYASGNTFGGGWFVVSSGNVLYCGNSLFRHLVLQYAPAPWGRGFVFGARGAVGTFLNDITVDFIAGSAYGRATVTQAATMSVGAGANITITDGTKFVVDQPVVVSATANGFTQSYTYFVTSVVGNVIQLALLAGGVGIAATNNTAVNIITYGFPLLEVVGYQTSGTQNRVSGSGFYHLDLETNAGTMNSAWSLQQGRSITFEHYYMNTGGTATLVVRSSNDTKIYVTDAVGGAEPTFDIDNAYASPIILGPRGAIGITAGSGNVGVGGSTLSHNISTDPRALAGGYMLYLQGQIGPDIFYNKVSNFIECGVPIGSQNTLVGASATIPVGTSGSSNVILTGAFGSSYNLPQILTNGDGIMFYISNPATGGTSTLTNTFSQNIIFAGSSATSQTLAAQTDYVLISRNNAGTLYWSMK